MTEQVVVDERFERRAATLRVTARLLAVGAAAGCVLGVAAPLSAVRAHEVVTTLLSAPEWGLIYGFAGLVLGTLTNAINAVVAGVALRRWSVDVVRWVVVPIPVAAASAIGATILNVLAAPVTTPTIVFGVGALVLAIVLGPWCFAPARPGWSPQIQPRDEAGDL